MNSAEPKQSMSIPYGMAVSQVKDYAIFMTNLDGRAVSWNEGVQNVLGWEEAQWLGQPISVLFTPEDLAGNIHEQELKTAAQTGSASSDRWQIKKDGTRFFAQGITTAIRGEDGRLSSFLKVVRDVTEQRHAELRLETQSEVNRVLAEATTVSEATQRIFDIVCTRLDWQRGNLWIIDPQQEQLRLRDSWPAETGQSEFQRMSREMSFAPGVGLPGRVWSSRQAVWIPDLELDTNFPRLRAARREGLRGALAFPIILGGNVHGVMEFLSGQTRQPDRELLRVMEFVGRELGQFVQRVEAQEELRRSEARSNAAVRTALDCIIGMDHEGRITEFNPAAERVFGYRREEVLGREMCEWIIPPELCESHRAGIRRYLSTGEAHVLGRRIEMPAMRKGGERFLSELSITRNPGEPPTFTGFMRDISEQKRAEEEIARLNRDLRQRISELEAILSVLPAGIGIAEDPDCRRIRVNPAAAAFLGLSVAANASLSAPEGQRPDYRMRIGGLEVPPEQLPLQIAARGTPVRDVEMRVERPDGTSMDILGYAVPLLDESGKPRGSVGAFIDITDRNRAAEALAESEARFRTMADQAPVMIWIADTQNLGTWYNKRWLEFVGRPMERELGHGWADNVHPEDLERCVQYCQKAFAAREPFTMEFRLRRHDGEYRWILDTGVPLYGPAAEFRGYIGSCIDVTDQKQSERELRHQENLLRTITENADSALLLLDLQGQIVFMNSAFTRITGYSHADVRGKSVHDVMHHRHSDGRDDPAEQCPISASSRELKPLRRHEDLFVRKDGSMFPVVVSIIPLERDGSKVGGVVEFRDVTHEKQAARERERFLEVGTDMLVVASLEGQFMWVSPAWERTLGWTPQEITSRPWLDFVHPDDHASTINEAAKLAQGQETVHFENRYRCKDGSYRWISWRVRPYLEEGGLLYGAATDVTERRQAEEAVRESEAKFRLLANTIPQLAWMAHPDGHVFWYNDRWYEYTGTSPQSQEGWGWQSVHHPQELPKVVEQWSRSIRTGEPFDMTFPLRGADGTFRPFLTRVNPLRNAEGRVVLWFGTNTDVSEQQRAAEERQQLLEGERAARAEAEAAGRLKDEFLATLSHELRTPLNAILGWSQLLERGGGNENTFTEGLAAIARNARTQTQLIEDLLDMSRIVSGTLKLDIQPVKLLEVVDAAIESVLPAAQAKELQIVKVLDGQVSPVSGDPIRLQQIVWNLLSNAVKFTPKGGRIQVRLERLTSQVQVSVSDTGQGIRPEFLPFLFERFRQADGSTTRRHGGLGLGLSIVKQLVELHGGTVHAESAGEGKGATFVISLPLSMARRDEEREGVRFAEEAADVAEAPDLSGVRVLVVDDDPDARTVARRMLENCKAQVFTAESAAQALDLLRLERPDVLLADIGMPEADGYELIRLVRRLPAAEGGRTPAAALTAFARSEDRRRALMAGYQSHIVKPVEPLELVAVVASLAGRMDTTSGGKA